MNWTSYELCGPSGIGWLEIAPLHWERVPLKYLALKPESLFLDGDWIESKDLADAGLRYLTTGNVGEGCFKEQGLGFITHEKFRELGCTEVLPGDILVSRLNRPIGRSCVVPDLGHEIVTSVDNVILRADADYSRVFLVYLFSSWNFFGHTDTLSRGATMQRISRSQLGNIRVVVPPLKEQIQIANFLDYETATIDALIEKQQQLIRLLKEKRQAVISHAVTKGLNPDAPMRDSGVEWLGEVPAHWEVVATSRVSDLTTGGSDTQDANPDGEYPFFVRSQTVERIDTYSFEGEGVLTSGDGAGVGKIFHHYIGRLELHQRVYLFHNFRRVSGRYFFYFLREHLAIVALAGNAKSTVDSLRRPMLRTFPVCVPPKDEQVAITEFLDAAVTQIDSVISRQSDFRKLLQERRAALISAAVTGKIDVRGWTPPESATEQEVA